MDGFKGQIDNLKARLGHLSFNQKVLLGAVATASVISVAVFSLWLQKEDSAVLFTNLTPEDASAALAELAKQDINAELTNGGSTIMVPETAVHRLRVDLAAKGVPSSGTVGFEIFDGKQYGLTEFLQNVNFKRALEGELTKSIESLQGIQSARVHLVLPKPSIFKKLASPATASVVLNMGRDARLGDNQINGIQSLVAGSVENLETDGVTVIDQHGKVLSAAMADDEAGRSESQLALRKEVEGYLGEKASSMLDGVLGSGRSIVRVNAALNFEKIDKEREVFDPAATVVRSEVRNEETNPATGGANENSTTNYEINRTVEHIVGHTGGIKTLSVAVFVDGTYETGEDGVSTYQPLGEDELGQLRRVVQTAIGLNSVRGDQIEVVNMQFQQQEVPVTGMAPDWVGIVTQYGGKVVLLVALMVIMMTLKKNLGGLLSNTGNAVGGSGAGAAGSNAVAEEPEHFDGIPEMDDQVISDIQDYAADNPERVAEVIQSWIREIDLSGNVKQAAGD
ncbi:MAG: flagellar basal-body MS-ring/collar protein FliF [Candidatus Krumholzibacteria bacterium]|nr:flagellar basal-body MS-ring/collar protein FliF [Candidatus Krumholzibacteria bacterium]